MKVAVAKETAPNERRVALVPEALGKLIAAGLEVLVEQGAGDGAAIPDRAYADAGATRRLDATSCTRRPTSSLRVQKPSDGRGRQAARGPGGHRPAPAAHRSAD